MSLYILYLSDTVIPHIYIYIIFYKIPGIHNSTFQKRLETILILKLVSNFIFVNFFLRNSIIGPFFKYGLKQMILYDFCH